MTPELEAKLRDLAENGQYPFLAKSISFESTIKALAKAVLKFAEQTAPSDMFDYGYGGEILRDLAEALGLVLP